MSRFNTSINYPLIPNAQHYMFEKQYVSIISEDRNVLKFPNSSEFEIELPQDYLNVQGIRLVTWKFPADLSVFNNTQQNNTLTFKITNPYNPGAHTAPYDPILDAIFAALYNYTDNYTITIENGSYTASQMELELTNKFNYVVTNMILNSSYLSPSQKETFSEYGYSSFIIKYNQVTKKLWFGNTNDEFELTNEDTNPCNSPPFECGINKLPEYDGWGWGLPWYLGLPRKNVESIKSQSIEDTRFYYLDESSGYWLYPNPDLVAATSFYVESKYNLNLDCPFYFYMELKGFNFMDETSPYNFSTFTMQTNGTNGIVKSAFAKIPSRQTNREQQWYEVIDGYKIFNPPAERIRKINVKIRWHDGTLVDFSNIEYSFLLEMTLFRPQNAKNYTMYTPESISNGNN